MAATRKPKEPATKQLNIPVRLYNRMMKIGDEAYWVRILENFMSRFGR